MRFCIPAVAAAVVSGCVMGSAGTARAGTITYIETATATGSLGGQSFTNVLLTLTATGNTAGNIVTDGIQSAEMFVPLEVTIPGLGSTEFTDPIIVVFNGHTGPNEAYGFGDTYPNFVQGYSVLSTFVPYTGTFYGLQTDIGPIDGIAMYNPGAAYNTAAGAFQITSAENATFQAVL